MKTWRKAVETYVSIRRAFGPKLKEVERQLLSFASFLEKENATFITVRLALQWARNTPSTRPAQWAKRLTAVRGFSRYCSAVDPRTEIPSWELLPFHAKRANPYLYAECEVRNLLKAALCLSPEDRLRRHTYHVLLGLLAVSGLRISEALNLRVSDVDLKEGVLTVRSTKNQQFRLVPLHLSVKEKLAEYRFRRDDYLAGRTGSEYFFVSQRGNRLDQAEVRRTFYVLSRKIGLRGPLDSHGPRIHDLRHRFAVETLVRWYRTGKDPERLMPVLSTYLGHAAIAATYWYLTACPELMRLPVKRLEERWRRTP